MADLDRTIIPKWRVLARFRVNVRVRVTIRVRVGVIRFKQVQFNSIQFISKHTTLKSGSNCYGHAAATTSHPYFGIIVWFKLSVGATVTGCNIHGLILFVLLGDRLHLKS